MDLRLDDPHRAAELARGLDRVLGREGGRAARHRHAENAQHGLRLILVNVHAKLPRTRRQPAYFARSGAIFMQASTRPRTASTDLSNIAFSAPLNSISTMRSTPFEPSTTGTPT